MIFIALCVGNAVPQCFTRAIRNDFARSFMRICADERISLDISQALSSSPNISFPTCYLQHLFRGRRSNNAALDLADVDIAISVRRDKPAH
jgi:hypothetical protein